MKDSNVGAMGVVARRAHPDPKVAALGALARADAAAPLLAGWCAARALPALDVYAWPYARAAGTGEAFTRERTTRPCRDGRRPAGRGRGGPAIVAVAVDGAGAWYSGLVVALVAMGVALLVQAAVAKRLGGLTGDVYGMGIELAEAAALVVGCALVRLAG